MSEFDWIAKYFAPLAKRDGAAGLVDDVAELSGQARIITTDALVEGVHFLSSDPVETVARKLVRVNVSDIIAKGAYPDEALLTLGWPKSRDEDELAAFAGALGEELTLWGGSLIGGDTVSVKEALFLSLTLTGKPAGPQAPVRRSGAKAGDEIWVTGKIGGLNAGLSDARAQNDTAAAARYRAPQIPPLETAKLIAEYATASMDVSDGLLADLQKLAVASDRTAHLQLEAVPLFQAVSTSREEILRECASGDDYQCLFTAPEAAREALQSGLPDVARIGRIGACSSPFLQLTLHGETVELPSRTGYSH